MLDWDTLHRYLKFEIPYEESGYEEAKNNWKPEEGPLIPLHEPMGPFEFVVGFNKVLAGEISFPEFKRWARIALSAMGVIYERLSPKGKEVYEDFDTFVTIISPQNASKKAMTRLIHQIKEEFIVSRYALIEGDVDSILDEIGRLEQKRPLSEEDFQEYISLLERLGDMGDVEAINYEGTIFYAGRQGHLDFVKAKELYEKAGKLGSVSAVINLGYIHYYARCGGEPDYQAAYDCFYFGSKAGSHDEQVEADYKLADIYYNGYLGKKRINKAHELVKYHYYDEVSDTDNPYRKDKLLGDLAIRMARFADEGSHYPRPKEALRYYLQAKHLIEQRWDGEWFGDKKLLESCDEAIKRLKDRVFGGEFPGQNMALNIVECSILTTQNDGFGLCDIAYDPKRKAIYIYLLSHTLKTIEEIPFTGTHFLMCLVIPCTRGRVYFDNPFARCYNHVIIDKPHSSFENPHWELVALDSGQEAGEEDIIASFNAKFLCNAYIGFIRTENGAYAHLDPRYQEPDTLDKRYAFAFRIEQDVGGVYGLNARALENYGFFINTDELPISEGLKKDINYAVADYQDHYVVMDDDEDEGDWFTDFAENVERPLAERLQEELGDDYIIIFDELTF